METCYHIWSLDWAEACGSVVPGYFWVTSQSSDAWKPHKFLAGVILTIYVTVGCAFLLSKAQTFWPLLKLVTDRLTISVDGSGIICVFAKDRGSATLHLSGWSCLTFAEFGLSG